MNVGGGSRNASDREIKGVVYMIKHLNLNYSHVLSSLYFGLYGNQQQILTQHPLTGDVRD